MPVLKVRCPIWIEGGVGLRQLPDLDPVDCLRLPACQKKIPSFLVLVVSSTWVSVTDAIFRDARRVSVSVTSASWLLSKRCFILYAEQQA
jgi:hypothetical protein